MPAETMEDTRRKYSHNIQRGGHSQQSLMSAMGKFVKAVETMDETIMIPSRLMDMNAAECSPDRNMNTSQNVTSQALIPAQNNGSNAGDLYSFYSMLNSVRSELGSGCHGSELERQKSQQNTDSDVANNAAKLFRHHLKGLFDVLHTLTDTADTVTHIYQEDVGETPSRSSSYGSTPPSLPSYL